MFNCISMLYSDTDITVNLNVETVHAREFEEIHVINVLVVKREHHCVLYAFKNGIASDLHNATCETITNSVILLLFFLHNLKYLKKPLGEI